MGLFHETQVFKTYLNGLSEEELRTVAHELFVYLQNSRALHSSLQAQFNALQHAYCCQHHAKTD
jgi:hypothetical protein